MEKEVRLELRVRNNRLYQAIFTRYHSVAEFCREYDFQASTIGSLLNLKDKPTNSKTGKFTPTAMRLSEIFKILPEDLFPLEIYGIDITKFSTEVSSNDMLRLSGHHVDPLSIEDKTQKKFLEDFVHEIVEELDEREQLVLNKLYGLNGHTVTTQTDIAKEISRSKSTVGVIEKKIMRKLRRKVYKRYDVRDTYRYIRDVTP